MSVMSPQDRTAKTYKFTLFVYNCNFLVLLSATVCSQNINKQIVNIAEENLTDFSFLSRYHYTKSRNYLKRRYLNRHSCLLGHPVWSILHLTKEEKDDIILSIWCCYKANRFFKTLVKSLARGNGSFHTAQLLCLMQGVWNIREKESNWSALPYD